MCQDVSARVSTSLHGGTMSALRRRWQWDAVMTWRHGPAPAQRAEAHRSSDKHETPVFCKGHTENHRKQKHSEAMCWCVQRCCMWDVTSWTHRFSWKFIEVELLLRVPRERLRHEIQRPMQDRDEKQLEKLANEKWTHLDIRTVTRWQWRQKTVDDSRQP